MSSTEYLNLAKTARECAFRRVLLVHTGQEPEVDLLDYAAMLGGEETTIAAYPHDGILRSMAAAARGRFETHGASPPILRALPELDVDWVLEAARAADLLVMRTTNDFGAPRALERRILSKSPCPVSFALQPPSRIKRVLVGIELDESGSAVLDQAVSLCRSAGAEELLAVYCCAPDVNLDLNEAESAQFRADRELELYRFMARRNLRGVSCTPVLQESVDACRGLARAAEERSADLIIVGRRAETAPRMARALVRECSAAVMQVSLPPPPGGFREKLRRIFSNPEPKFS